MQWLLATIFFAAGAAGDNTYHVGSAWSKLMGHLLDGATEVCSLAKNHLRKPGTWWQIEQVDDAVQDRWAWFKIFNSQKKWSKVAETQEAEIAYNDAKHMLKHAFWLAKSEAEKEKYPTVLQDRDGVFRITKMMECTNQYIAGGNCVCNYASELVHTDGDMMMAYELSTMPDCSMPIWVTKQWVAWRPSNCCPSEFVCNLDLQST